VAGMRSLAGDRLTLATEWDISPIRTAQDAIAAHMRWKISFHLAIRMRESMSERAMDAIEDPRKCSIGQWLVSPGTMGVRRTAEYGALVARHEEFHVAMQRMANLINSEDYLGAARGLEPGGRFDLASKAIASAITCLDRIERMVLG
jgi:methyl-accepting chemotaxis protein